MIFKVTNIALGTSTHAGVLEFTAEEGVAYAPKWLLNTLSLERDDLMRLERVYLPQGRFVKIQPQSVDFLDITDPKAVLENAFVNFSTLSKGDRILFNYNFKSYEILVLEIGPEGPGISIVETDLEVDFAPPVGYVPPEPTLNSLEESKKQSAIKIRRLASQDGNMSKAKRQGVRICGRKTRRSAVREAMIESSGKGTEPNPEATINLAEGQLFFGYPLIPYPSSPVGSRSSLNEPAPTS